jgi:hypothetical protein
VNPGEDPTRTLGTSDVAYQQEVSWDQSYNDVYLLDIKTGTRKKILEHWGATSSLSPGGNYVLYFDEIGHNWFTYKVADGTRTNLTASLPVKFYDEGHDTPSPPSLGSAGWTEGDKSVPSTTIDIWEIRPDGTKRMVTNGSRKQHLIFGIARRSTRAAGGGPGGGEWRRRRRWWRRWRHPDLADEARHAHDDQRRHTRERFYKTAFAALRRPRRSS